MTNVTGADLSVFESGDADLVFRATKAVVMIAPAGGSTISTIVDATGANLSIPSDYVTVGYIDKSNGMSFAPKLTTSTSDAYGQAQPIAYYITGSEFDATFTMLEHRKSTLQAYYAQDLSAVAANSTTGEVTWDVPDQPQVINPRLLVIGQHRSGTDAIWLAHWMPKVMITNMQQQDWKDSGDITFQVTYTALVDDSVGTSRRPFIAGPGMTSSVRAAMGF